MTEHHSPAPEQNESKARLEERLGYLPVSSERASIDDATIPEEMEADKTPEALGINNYELNLIGSLVHGSVEAAMHTQHAGDLSDAVMSRYQNVNTAIASGEGEKTMAQALAALVAAGAIENPADASGLVDRADRNLVDLIGEEQVDALKRFFHDGFEVKFNPNYQLTQSEKIQQLTAKFMGGAGDVKGNPKLAAALLAYGAGATIRDPGVSLGFMNELATLSH